MSIDNKYITDQIKRALDAHQAMKARSQYDDLSDCEDSAVVELIILLSSTIERIAPPNSRYFLSTKKAIEDYGSSNGYVIPIFVGILKTLNSDYQAGYLKKMEDIIHGDIFSDFIEMAEYLLCEGYKDPSAVLVGGVLEEQLRKLCENNNIDITENNKPKKADRLNSDLAKANVYTKLDQKNITAWLDLRNKAAHGNYNEYSKEQVTLMLQGVRNFISQLIA